MVFFVWQDMSQFFDKLFLGWFEVVRVFCVLPPKQKIGSVEKEVLEGLGASLC